MKHKLERLLLSPVIVLCALLVAACNPAATQTTSTEGGIPPKADGQPQKGGTLRIMGGGYVSYGTTDSHRAAFGPPNGFAGQSVNQVVRRKLYSGNYEIITDLAESWQVSLRLVSLIPSSCIKA